MRGNRNALFVTFSFPSDWTNSQIFALGRTLIKRLDYTELKSAQCQYDADPAKGGVTYVFFLAESHLILETFREDGFIAELEIVTCRKAIDKKKVWETIARSGCQPMENMVIRKDEDGDGWLRS